MTTHRCGLGLSLTIACLFFLVGCGDPLMKGVLKANETNAAKIANCYALYKSRHGMKAPKDKEELVEFISGNASIKRNLERMGVETSKFDSYFTSERDGKELIVHWSVDGIDVPASVFEATADEDGNDLIAGAGLKGVGEQEDQNHLDIKVNSKSADDDSAKPQDLTLASWTGSLDAAIGV